MMVAIVVARVVYNGDLNRRMAKTVKVTRTVEGWRGPFLVARTETFQENRCINTQYNHKIQIQEANSAQT